MADRFSYKRYFNTWFNSPEVKSWFKTLNSEQKYGVKWSLKNSIGLSREWRLLVLRFEHLKLVSLPPLPLELESLYCDDNFLTSLPSLPETLVQLWSDKNQLTELPSLPPDLNMLSCAHNKLKELPPLPEFLSYFSCHHNELTSLPELPAMLNVFYCENNQLRFIPPLPSENLASFRFKNNPIVPALLPFLSDVKNPVGKTRKQAIANYNKALEKFLLAGDLSQLRKVYGMANQVFETNRNSVPVQLLTEFLTQPKFTGLTLDEKYRLAYKGFHDKFPAERKPHLVTSTTRLTRGLPRIPKAIPYRTPYVVPLVTSTTPFTRRQNRLPLRLSPLPENIVRVIDTNANPAPLLSQQPTIVRPVRTTPTPPQLPGVVLSRGTRKRKLRRQQTRKQ